MYKCSIYSQKTSPASYLNRKLKEQQPKVSPYNTGFNHLLLQAIFEYNPKQDSRSGYSMVCNDIILSFHKFLFSSSVLKYLRSHQHVIAYDSSKGEW